MQAEWVCGCLTYRSHRWVRSISLHHASCFANCAILCIAWQLMQLYIPEDVRGLVGGVQQSLNSLFFVVSYAFGIVLPDPRDFHLLVAIGFCSVGVAAMCYMFGVFRKQDILGS